MQLIATSKVEEIAENLLIIAMSEVKKENPEHGFAKLPEELKAEKTEDVYEAFRLAEETVNRSDVYDEQHGAPFSKRLENQKIKIALQLIMQQYFIN